MKKKLSFQKKIIANLNPEQMSNVNGGIITGPKCPVFPEPLTKMIDCNEPSRGGAICISALVCPPTKPF